MAALMRGNKANYLQGGRIISLPPIQMVTGDMLMANKTAPGATSCVLAPRVTTDGQIWPRNKRFPLRYLRIGLKLVIPD